MRNCRSNSGNEDQSFLCILDGFSDRFGYFLGFAKSNADVSISVTDNNGHAESEVFAAFYDLGDSTDVDDGFLKIHLGCIYLFM